MRALIAQHFVLAFCMIVAAADAHRQGSALFAVLFSILAAASITVLVRNWGRT